MSLFLKEAGRLADYIMESCVGRSGFLCSHADLEKNTSFGTALVSELGDYIPEFFGLWKRTGKRRYRGFAEAQAHQAIQTCQSSSGAFYTRVSCDGRVNKRWVFLNDIADLVVGVSIAFEKTHDPLFSDSLEKFFSWIAADLVKGYIPAGRFLSLPLPVAASGYTGVFVEELSRLSRMTSKQNYLNMAWRLARPWIRDPLFRRDGLFYTKRLYPFYIPKLMKTAFIMKPNTNMGFGLMELSKAGSNQEVRQALGRLLSSFKTSLYRNGFFSSFCSPERCWGISLGTNAAILELLLASKERGLVETCVSRWLSLQDGLVRNSPERATMHMETAGFSLVSREIPGSYSWLDSQTDFSVLLAKLYQLTGKRKYKKACLGIVKAVMEKHRVGPAYVECYDMEGRKPIGKIANGKYMALFLKALLVADGIDGQIDFDLFRDR